VGEVKIGTCGYSYWDPPEGWKETYESKLQAFSNEFGLVEINRTFYQLPQVSTCEKWRRRTEDSFEFTVKAWQALTHTTRSPTWRNRDELTEQQKDQFGHLRPNESNREAWKDVRQRAKALEAEVCLLQTPPGFEASDENEDNMRELLSGIERDNLQLAWEPRGNWTEPLERVGNICREVKLMHLADPLRADYHSFHDGYAYLRLHGLNDDPHDYDYDYSEEELKDLAEQLRELERDHDRVYCLFNNYEMYANAQALRDLLEE
jgi:uncharacterized protein YecE (DUF72 family)